MVVKCPTDCLKERRFSSFCILFETGGVLSLVVMVMMVCLMSKWEMGGGRMSVGNSVAG